jgi:NAD(P)-dependent dehydrogenase (short-subunit alcohol dehydrogenase family)
MNIEKQNIVITGANAGLGKALAHQAAKAGHHVVIISRSAGQLDGELQEAGVIGIAGDLSKKKEISRIAAQVLNELGHVDILVNNASQLGATKGRPLRLLIDTDCEVFEDVLATNLLGPFRLTKRLLSSMILRKRGRVINISSDAAVSAYETWGAYSISKAATDHMSRIWNAELAAVGIQFLAVDPGDMNTAMHRAAIPDADFDSLYQPDDVARDLWKFLAKDEFEKVRFTASEWRAS